MNYMNFPFLPEEYRFLSIALIIIFFILSNFIIDFNIRNKNIKLIIKSGICLRIVLIIIDNFHKIISFSGGDSRVFHLNGWRGLNNLPYWRLPFIESIMVPSYKLLGSPMPIFIVLLNLLSYVLAIVFLYKTLMDINYKENKRKKLIFLIISFSLVTALLNISLLREGIMLFFTTFSIYFFMKKEKKYQVISIISLFISSYLHSGMIFILFGYLYNWIMNKKGKKKYLAILLGIIVLIIIIICINQLPYFKGKDLESLSKEKIEDAGSRYVSEVSGPLEYILTSPLRLFYFLFSPTPNMFRNFKDIVTFILNSSIYIFFIYNSLKNYFFIRKEISKKDKIFIQSLFISFFLTAFAYGMGTIAAGTALRHRDKLLFLLMVLNYTTYIKFIKLKKTKFRRGKNEKSNRLCKW